MELKSYVDNTSQKTVSGTVFSHLRKRLFKLGVNVNKENYQSNEDNSEDRVILTADRRNANFRNPIVSQCNGTVFNGDYSKLLCMPPPPINQNNSLKLKQILYYLNNNMYHVTLINDGTTINLYHFKGKWVMSTSRGVEVNNLVWQNQKTYEQVFTEVLGEYPEFSWNSLDRNKSYTIGFKHSDYHPFMENQTEVIKRAWFISAYDLNSDTLYTSLDIGLPLQTSISSPQDFPVTSRRFHNWGELIQFLKHEAVNEFVANGVPLYGILLRSVNTRTTKEYSSLLIESDLFKKIRKMIYDKKYDFLLTKNGCDTNDRMKFITLFNTLTMDRDHIFIKLFPQYEELRNYYLSVIDAIVDVIEEKLRQVNMKDKRPIDKPYSSIVFKLADYFFALSRKILRVSYDSTSNQVARKIVRDFVTDPKYAEIYHRELNVNGDI